MGAVERRTRQREGLRAAMIEAARAIVLDEGYKALTMRRIAEAVDYSPAALYQYFENRDAIATALMEDGFEQLCAAFEPLKAIDDPADRLDATGRMYVQFGLEHSATYRLMFMDDPQITAAMFEDQRNANSAGARAYAALIEPVAQLHAQGRLRDGIEVQPLADTLWSSLHGIVSLKLTCPGFPATPVEKLLDTTLRVLYEGWLRRPE